MVAGGVDGPDLAKVAAVLKSVSPESLKIMRAHLREVAKPILADERAVVQTLTMSTTVTKRAGVLRRKTSTTTEGPGKGGGSGAKARTAETLNRRKGGVVGFAKAAKRARAKSGLRSTIARGMRITYTDSANSAGVVVRTSGTSMPKDQRGLAKAMNKGRWRHPVFAQPGTDRKSWSWVDQSVNRPKWWDETAQRHNADARRAMDQAMREWAELAAALTQRAGQ